MPRNMSFALTTAQFMSKQKTVTRRLGWGFLKAGALVCGVKKVRGLKKGEKITRLGLIKILSVRQEPLNAISQADVAKEGFPDLTPAQFIAFFCSYHNGVAADTLVNRIEFKHEW